MAQRINAVKIVRDYAKNLANQIKIDKVILFGSAVAGKMNYHSDLDVVILSPDFSQIEFIKRLQRLSRARQGESRKIPMDILGYTPAEFEKMAKESVVIAEAKEKGIDFVLFMPKGIKPSDLKNYIEKNNPPVWISKYHGDVDEIKTEGLPENAAWAQAIAF